MTTFEQLITGAHQAFLAQIAKYQLETLKHYPDDLVTDLAILQTVAAPGAKFAWKVGHTGTRLWPLGLHPKRNEHVTYVTRDSSSDRFYLLEFFPERFKLTELDAKGFENLEHTPIPYRQDGDDLGFWVTKNGCRIGYCLNEYTGNVQRASYRSTLTPVQGISAPDREALREFANFSVVQLARTLFVGRDEVWAKPISSGEA